VPRIWNTALQVLALQLFLGIFAPIAAANDKVRAAEHFALAESAEKREDWKTAIDEYQQAYSFSPHPSVLYNIAVNQERLGKLRDAAATFLRYLDEDTQAADREQVLERVRGLRERPSVVKIDAVQQGVEVVIDGEPAGQAPLEVSLRGGPHTVQGRLNSNYSTEHSILLEYGDSATLTLDLTARPGRLQVFCNVTGAEVRIDGTLMGRTPFHADLPSGSHEVAITAIGYQPVVRQVQIASQGSEQLRATMKAVPGLRGAGDDNPDPDQPQRRGAFVVGGTYGYQSSGGRYSFNVGLRMANRRLEAGLGLGYYGPETGMGASAEGRFYFTTGYARLYLRGAVIAGAEYTDGRSLAAEGMAGILLSPMHSGLRFGYEYFVEVGLHTTNGAAADPSMEEVSAFSIPLILGIQYRIGG
jgi:hypothetical protein